MKMITGLPKEQQQLKLNEIAVLYGVDLKKIMGINVAFDIVDNTDDIEPTFAQINPDQTKTVHKRVSKKLTSETFGDFEPKPSSINKSSKMQELKEKLSQLNTNFLKEQEFNVDLSKMRVQD